MRNRVPAGLVSTLEFLVLGPLAAVLVLVVIPRAFGVESACSGPLGFVSTDGDTYVGAMVALGTFGWIVTFLGVVYAGIAESRGVVLLLPAVFFAVLVLAGLAAAIVIGPSHCPF
jgi:hypothetical protein